LRSRILRSGIMRSGLEGRNLFISLLASKSLAREEKTNYLNRIKLV
jgi:hypothetical protein